MTLPGSGSITYGQIATELGRAGTSVSLNQSDVAALAGKTTAQAITVPNDFWGKSASTTYNFNSGEQVSNHSLGGEATVTLTASANISWTHSRTGSVNGSPSTASTTSSNFVQFTLPYYGSNDNASWVVTANGNPARSCTVYLSVGTEL